MGHDEVARAGSLVVRSLVCFWFGRSLVVLLVGVNIGSHTAVAIDNGEVTLDEIRVSASPAQTDQLLGCGCTIQVMGWIRAVVLGVGLLAAACGDEGGPLALPDDDMDTLADDDAVSTTAIPTTVASTETTLTPTTTVASTTTTVPPHHDSRYGFDDRDTYDFDAAAVPAPC